MKRITFNLFRKYLTRLAVYFFSIISVAYAQRVHQFTEGLYLETPYSYGREAVYSDEFLWGYYNAKTTTPKGGHPDWLAQMKQNGRRSKQIPQVSFDRNEPLLEIYHRPIIHLDQAALPPLQPPLGIHHSSIVAQDPRICILPINPKKSKQQYSI